MTYQPFDLSKKRVLVTGGNRGIGLGMSKALAAAGADVTIWGTNFERNQQAIQALNEIGNGKKRQAVVNVGSEDEVVQAMESACQSYGPWHAVFANAGIGRGGYAFKDIPYEQYREVLSVNLDGAFFTLREGAKWMIEGGEGGSLVGVSSLAAIEGAAGSQHYAATKGGLISMIKGIAVECARHGVRANAILPGWIATDMTEGAQQSTAFAEKVVPRIPARRWGKPEDFGGLAVYLASAASSYHSGDTLVVDGGYSIF
ncbi:MAG: SDR family NAD(P)-dependent oxidoreductase [Gammaproteobacteria bacterium]